MAPDVVTTPRGFPGPARARLWSRTASYIHRHPAKSVARWAMAPGPVDITVQSGFRCTPHRRRAPAGNMPTPFRAAGFRMPRRLQSPANFHHRSRQVISRNTVAGAFARLALVVVA